MAITPAKTPGPIMAISKSAHINEFIERVDTMINSAIGRMMNREGERIERPDHE